MFKKLSEGGKRKLLCVTAAVSCMAFPAMCFAGTESSSTSLSGVTSSITSSITDVKSEGLVIIGAAVGLGVIFWGAKLLWNKFKGMAK